MSASSKLTKFCSSSSVKSLYLSTLEYRSFARTLNYSRVRPDVFPSALYILINFEIYWFSLALSLLASGSSISSTILFEGFSRLLLEWMLTYRPPASSLCFYNEVTVSFFILDFDKSNDIQSNVIRSLVLSSDETFKIIISNYLIK